jgi:hypothetical protein
MSGRRSFDDDIESPLRRVLCPSAQYRCQTLLNSGLPDHYLAANGHEAGVGLIHLGRGLRIVAIEPFGHRDDDFSNGVLVSASARVLSLRHKTKTANPYQHRKQGGSHHCLSSCTVLGVRPGRRRLTCGAEDWSREFAERFCKNAERVINWNDLRHFLAIARNRTIAKFSVELV